jgi:prepilin-type N-terminal cleavage/methylation domain-containing protein
MTISIPPTESRARALRGGPGFTLTEIMIAATIGSIVLVGVLSAFVMIGRTGFLASGYSEMEAETRRGLEIFGDDARKATDIHWNTSQSVTLAVATATTASTLATYAYDSDRASATYGCFYRVAGDATSTLPRLVLVHNVDSDFAFQRFKLEQSGVANNSAANDLETKQLQVTLRARRNAPSFSAASATQSAVSARYILRNKRVSN